MGFFTMGEARQSLSPDFSERRGVCLDASPQPKSAPDRDGARSGAGKARD